MGMQAVSMKISLHFLQLCDSFTPVIEIAALTPHVALVCVACPIRIYLQIVEGRVHKNDHRLLSRTRKQKIRRQIQSPLLVSPLLPVSGSSVVVGEIDGLRTRSI